MIPLLIASALTLLPVQDDASMLGPIGRQGLPARGCAAFLWQSGSRHTLVAMAIADPAILRVAIGGRNADLVRRSGSGGGALGFADVTEFAGEGVTATLDMTIATRPDLTGGAAVPQAVLRIERAGGDTVVVPVAGLIGCS